MKIRNLIQKEFKIANQPPPKDKADYKAKMSTIQDLQKNPKLRDPESQANIMKRKSELDTWAKKNLKKEDADIDAQMKSDVLQFLNSKVVQIEKQIELAPANTPEEKENKEFALKLFNFVQAKLEQKDNGDNTITVPKSLMKKEDLDYKSEDILNKAGFDPADIDTYMKVFNDHGDTTDIKQMNMKEKVGLADAMSIVLASHGISNESVTKEDADVDAQFKSDVLQFLNSKVVQIEKQIELQPANTAEEKENKEFALKLFDFVQSKLEQKDDGNNTLSVPKSIIKK